MEKIAMKCTRAEYESIKKFIGKLENQSEGDFVNFNYLCNFENSKPHMFNPCISRKVYHEFNKNIFLKACDIKVKKDKRKKMFKKTIKLLKSFDELNFDIKAIDNEYGTDGFFKITITGNKTK